MTDSTTQSRFRRGASRALAVLGGITLFFLVLLILLPLLLLRGPGVPGRVILELDLSRGLIETVPEDPIGAFLERNQLTLRGALDALQRGQTDDRVVGLVARVGAGTLSMAQAEELRAAVGRFRESGKPTIAFAESFGEFGAARSDYYLATAFEEIHLQPSGDVGLTGLIAEVPFAGQALDRLGIVPRMGSRHEYKDAVNLFTEEEMTEPQREAMLRMLTSVYENLVGGISAGRDLPVEEVRRLLDEGPHFGDEAVRNRLVDRLSYRDEVYDSVKARLGGGEYLYVQHYLSRAGRPNRRGPQIALIHGVGAVQTGESQSNPLVGGVMGSESITRAFREATEAADVRAIVFRVDSPGGSYVASDAIWRETLRAREAGKPVIVSMGDVAASGGYFVAMGADRIVAQPSTITGSIGVYAGKVLITELSERLGITWDDVRVGGNATMWSFLEDFSPSERARLETNLDRIYADFTAKAAQGRGLSRDSVHALARGRIWTGADAARLGLVDELGGMDVALRLARELSGLDAGADVHVRTFPRQRSLLEMLFQPHSSSSYPASLQAALTVATGMDSLLRHVRELGIFSPRGSLSAPPTPRLR